MARATVYTSWTEQLIRETCCECGMPFAMSRTFHDVRYEDGKCFCCPAGHEQYYTRKEKTEKQLREERDRLARRLSASMDTARRWRENAEGSARSAAAYKGHLTRLRNRITQGVCPHCNRTFENVMRHMASQHPEHVEKAREALAGGSS